MNLSVAPQADAEVNWSEVKYFEKAEFKCDCNGKYCDGYPAEIDVDLVELLEKARTHYGKAMQITSGLRCKKRNAELAGSSPVSKHLEGKAADVWIVGTAANNAALVKWFQAQPEVNYSYTGFGAVHVDVK
ncbi:D-Ala-D-Ala carboxypeptidase family metallohydrolase [Emergencia timonensis]|nr:D-Ala-D-Ala carboxypeptidase family metallohydrolase [Emergencia timonensis]WNX87354.1 D-Ala-D-Ala carboxypeptidase family metallohydrolase [Emergencia timonensis]